MAAVAPCRPLWTTVKCKVGAEGCIGGSLPWGAAWCVVQKLSNYPAPLPFRQVPRGHMLCKASWGIPYDPPPPPPHPHLRLRIKALNCFPGEKSHLPGSRQKKHWMSLIYKCLIFKKKIFSWKKLKKSILKSEMICDTNHLQNNTNENMGNTFNLYF